jgi:hypothetical protein
MPVENSYQMFTRLDGAGVFVKRDSWSHPRTVAKVISVGGLTSGPLPGLPLYPTAGSQKANCDGGNLLSEPAKIQEFASPGTFAYTVIERPTGWPN